MGQVRQLDERMNAAGLLRLMLTEPLAMNMSNTLRGVHDPDEAKSRPAAAPRRGLRKRLLAFPPVKHVLLCLYDHIFRWYYED